MSNLIIVDSNSYCVGCRDLNSKRLANKILVTTNIDFILLPSVLSKLHNS